MRVADAERIARAGGEPAVELVLGLLAEITALRERVDEIERLLKQDSRNSSKAAPNDPPMTRQQRREEARRRAKESLRKQRGGQPGHEGKARELAAPERVDQVVEHVPVVCGCGHRFDGSERLLGDPVVRQNWELPEVVALVIEHRLHRLLCPGCGRICTTGETCRLQQRSVLRCLQDAATAAQHQQPIPSLAPT